MNKQRFIGKQRLRRRHHTRSKSRGTAERPRLCVFRSHHHVACQMIDDATGNTLVSVSTAEEELRGKISNGGNCDAATQVGKLLAERALAAGINKARFDRGHYKYHGRVAALADAAREGGLSL